MGIEPRWSSVNRSAAYHLFLLIFLVVVFYLAIFPSVQAGTETLISVNGTIDSEVPAVSGDWIVWEDNRDTTRFKIFAYNVVTGEERVVRGDSTGGARSPRISGTTIVWQDDRSGDGDIFSYDLGSGTETRITFDTHDQSAPSIDGSRIVWQDMRNGVTYDIYQTDILTSKESLISPDTDATNQKFPVISGNLVAWQDYRNGATADIFMNDTSSGILYNLTPANITTNQIFPSISGLRVVWVDKILPGTGKIRMNDTSSWASTLIDNAGSGKLLNRPSISGTKIVWLDTRNRAGGKYDIFYRDLSGSGQINITTPSASVVTINDANGNMMGPAISGDRIVWTDLRNGKRDIYLYTLDRDEVCPAASFTIPAQTGALPHSVQFTDTSSAGTRPTTHWKWEFGDGNTSFQPNPLYTYTVPGNFNVRLTISNSLCRNETPVSNIYKISVGSSPVALFTTNRSSGVVDLPVQFNDTSLSATMWNWSFGDSGNSWFNSTDPLQKNVTFSYTSPGTYVVTLNASNEFGFSRTTKTITAMNGANENADTSIAGITTDNRYGGQFLIFDGIILAGYSNPSPSVLITPPRVAHGWQNITFVSEGTIGFHDCGNGTFMGNISSVIFQTTEMPLAAFTPRTGTQSSINYSITVPTYPVDASVNTQVWEGAIPSDRTTFEYIASHSNFNAISDIAYTTKITRTGFPVDGSAVFHVSVNSSWVAQIPSGRAHTYLVRVKDDGSAGEVLPARYLSTDPLNDLDSFEIESPRGPSTFGLALVSGSGNPLQLITLTIASHTSIQQSTGSSDDGGAPWSGGHGQGAAAGPNPNAAPPALLSPPGSGLETIQALSPDTKGVIAKTVDIPTPDNHGALTLGQGAVALDHSGNPLSSITITTISPDTLPSGIHGTAISYAGIAYDLQPEGATFSPGITVSFSAPQPQPGQQYSVQVFDRATGTWTEIPCTYNYETGKAETTLTHFCYIALFARTVPVSGTTAPVQAMEKKSPAAAQAPPSTAISIFLSMIAFVLDLMRQYILVIVVAGGVAVLLYERGRKRRMDKIRYKL
jgi:beta propeller repeat protein